MKFQLKRKWISRRPKKRWETVYHVNQHSCIGKLPQYLSVHDFIYRIVGVLVLNMSNSVFYTHDHKVYVKSVHLICI